MTQHDSGPTTAAADYETRRRKWRSWNLGNPGNAAIRREVTAAVLDAAAGALRGDGDLLDAGCGRGWWLHRLVEEGVAPERLYGIDIDERSVATARTLPGASVQVGDVRDLPYPDGRFSAVFMLLVASTLPDGAAVEQAAREAWRVLAPGGVLAIWDPRIPSESTRLVRPRELAAGTGVRGQRRSLTLFPPLARRLGGAAERWYPRLARVPALRSHRLYVAQRVH